MNKNAITLLEVLTVIVIIAILASIAIPNFIGKIERTRGERAIANIEIIKDAYKMYVIKTPTNLTLDGLNNLNSTFHLELTDPWFNYVHIGITPTTFGIRVERHGGFYNGRFIQYNLDLTTGIETWGGDWPWLP